jgi:hypothetical protein
MKVDEESFFSDAGRQSDSNDVHSLNASLPIVSSFENDSKTSERRLEQY